MGGIAGGGGGRARGRGGSRGGEGERGAGAAGGGNPWNDEISDQVQTFDVEKYEWKDEAPLLVQLGGNEGGGGGGHGGGGTAAAGVGGGAAAATGGGGLLGHQAVDSPSDNGVTIICLGGFIDKSGETHPNHMAVFDLAY